MTQHPNEKDAPSDWVYPDQKGPYSHSWDGAPQGPPPDYGYVGPSHATSPPGPYQTPVPDAGPSSSSAQEGGTIASFFGNKGPPPMWHRPAPPQLPYSAFPPMSLISNSKNLSQGFPELPPPCQLSPHPFATHDVMEEDWKRFLADIKKGASLSGAQRIKSNVLPTVMGMSLVTGLFATFAIEKRMKARNRDAAGDIVDHWNHYFFGPRRMEVVLCQGSERLSGRLGAAPVGDPQQERMARRLRRRGSDSSSDSSSDSGAHGYSRDHGSGLFDKQARRAAKRARREAKRERRGERRARKEHGEDKLPYQLFVTTV